MSARTKRIITAAAIVLFVFLLQDLTMTHVVHAAGLVDETTSTDHLYSKYPVNNYQLDFFVDSSWDWLPWNWGDGIGKSVTYAIYAITNFLWIISVYLSYATGYLIQQAYSLDFIKDTTDAVGKNMQVIAGVSKSGFSSDGFYPGLILLLILALGIYVAYTGLLKRETSKAISAVISFVVIFITSAGFIAYAPDYIGKINEFSADMSTSALNTGSKMIMQNKKASSESGVDAIRDSLFEIQVKQPWTLLEFGDSSAKKVGDDRVNKLEKTDPFKNKGKDRTEIVKSEIEDKDNDNLTTTKAISRLGVTAFVVVFDVIITIFVFLLTAIMIFSQVLFIIYAIFLPISCLLAMIPSFNGMMKSAIMRLFNTIMLRAGITIVLTLTFCISSMIYGLSSTMPFFLVAFLQIVTFGGIWAKLGELMGMMQLKSSDSQAGAQRLTRRGSRMIRQVIGNAAFGGALGNSLRKLSPSKKDNEPNGTNGQGKTKPTTGGAVKNQNKRGAMDRAGRKLGDVLDTKKKMADKAKRTRDQLKDLPTNAKYGVKKGKDATKRGIDNFKDGIQNQRQANQTERDLSNKRRREELAKRKLALQSDRKPTDGTQQSGKPKTNVKTAPDVAVKRQPSTTKATPRTQPDTPNTTKRQTTTPKPTTNAQTPVTATKTGNPAVPPVMANKQPVKPVKLKRLTGTSHKRVIKRPTSNGGGGHET